MGGTQMLITPRVAAIDRLALLDWLLPHCDRRRVALLYPKGNEGPSPGWVKNRPDVDRAVEAYREGTLEMQNFGSITQKGKAYRISGAQRLGLVPHRDGAVYVFCVDLDDHVGDGGNVGLLDAAKRFLGAEPVVYSSKRAMGLHLYFRLAKPVPVVEFVRWLRSWGFNRKGQIEVFPKTAKLTQVWLPNEPNDAGGDTYRSGDFESCVVKELHPAPSIRLTNAALDFLRGFVSLGGRNDALNKAAHELGSKGVPRDDAWQLCRLGAQLCGLLDEEPNQTEHTFESGYSANSARCKPQSEATLPIVYLPGGTVTISDAARKLGQLLASTGRYYYRGGAIVSLEKDEGNVHFKAIRPAALASQFEIVATLRKLTFTRQGSFESPTICAEQQAKLIAYANPLIEALPAICLLSPCPVLIDRCGNLSAITGYDPETGIMASGPPPELVTLDEARSRLLNLLSDFVFATEADRSRAVASLITPAIVFGGLLPGRAPVDLGEADQSQAGKGYRNKLTAAIYRQRISAVTQKRGGVGSLEETFNSLLIAGRNFIALDNVRGRIDSPAIESFLTEDCYLARVPYEPSIEIDPRRVIILLTSNRAELTPDLANRSSCVRILKQPERHQFRQYEGGDILDHVRVQQPGYLGAVFAIIRAWNAAGRPTTLESRHDFRPWARSLDWIVQNLFGLPPLMDGHVETKIRMSNPSLSWLRDVAHAVRRANQLYVVLRAAQILDVIVDQQDIEIPGFSLGDDLAEEATKKKVLQAMGRRLGQCFKGECEISLDGVIVTRDVAYDSELRHDAKVYRFSIAPVEVPAHRSISGAVIGAGDSQDRPLCHGSAACACLGACPAPMNPIAIGESGKSFPESDLHDCEQPYAPIAPDSSQGIRTTPQCVHEANQKYAFTNSFDCIGAPGANHSPTKVST